jgi:general secretion pathway protein B
MSFILDALKKSEIERQRQSVPGLMDTRSVQRRSRLPIWALALGVLLGINLLVLTFVLWRKETPPAHASRAADTATATAATAAAAAEPAAADPSSATAHFSPLDSAPVYAPEIPVPAEDGAAPAPSPAAHPGSGGALGSAPAHATHRSDPLLTDRQAQEDDDNQEILPSINEISLSGAQALPELHLDVHVYGTRPAERFVYINMRKYHEGATLQEGPVIERIRRDGVVLNYQGVRFVLPRQP